MLVLRKFLHTWKPRARSFNRYSASQSVSLVGPKELSNLHYKFLTSLTSSPRGSHFNASSISQNVHFECCVLSCVNRNFGNPFRLLLRATLVYILECIRASNIITSRSKRCYCCHNGESAQSVNQACDMAKSAYLLGSIEDKTGSFQRS